MPFADIEITRCTNAQCIVQPDFTETVKESKDGLWYKD